MAEGVGDGIGTWTLTAHAHTRDHGLQDLDPDLTAQEAEVAHLLGEEVVVDTEGGTVHQDEVGVAGGEVRAIRAIAATVTGVGVGAGPGMAGGKENDF